MFIHRYNIVIVPKSGTTDWKCNRTSKSIYAEISVPSHPTSWKKVSQNLSKCKIHTHIPENPLKG